jgi:hypothetical protein
MATDQAYALNISIDDIKTKTVERLISPLVHLVSHIPLIIQSSKIIQMTSLHANMQPISGAPTRDPKEVLARLRDNLNGFISTGQQIIQNHPFGTEKVIAQLHGALNDVAIAG